jgi:hypothetical protein
MVSRGIRELVLPVAIALAVVACGGTTPGVSSAPMGAATAPPAVGPACDLLTDAAIERITGATVESKTDSIADTVYANACRWTLKRTDGGTAELDLGILSPGGRDRYDHSGGVDGLAPIDGLPADAAGEDSNTGTIFAVRNDTLVDVFTLGLGTRQAIPVELTRAVLEHLFGSSGPAATPGATTSTPGGDAVADPCSLLTDVEILDVTGFAATGHAITPTGGLWDTSCVWQVAGASEVPASITVTIKSPDGRANWDQYMVPFTSEFTAVPSLGDAAYEKVHWPTHVLVGDTYLSVKFSDFPDPEGPVSTDLARRVVAHLAG